MLWIALYGTIALAVAVTALVVAEWVREPGSPAPEHPGFFASLAGLLWPAVVIGLAQWALIAAIASPERRMSPAAAVFDELQLTPSGR
jgi:hypothetical protein